MSEQRDTQFLQAATAMWEEQQKALGFIGIDLDFPQRELFHIHMRNLIAYRLYDFASHVLDQVMAGQELKRIPDMPELPKDKE